MTPKESRRLYRWALKTAEDLSHEGETLIQKAYPATGPASKLTRRESETLLRKSLYYLRRAIQHVGMAEAYFLSFARRNEEVPDELRHLDDHIADQMGFAAILLMPISED